MTRPLVQPTINLNGTNHEDLMIQQSNVITAIDNLLVRLGQAMPHGRDFQLKPETYRDAADAWNERINLVALLRAEVIRHAEGIFKQKPLTKQ